MQNTPENPPEKAPENPPETPVLSEHPSRVPGDGYSSYRADCPVCEKQTWWHQDSVGSWCHDCCSETPVLPKHPNVPSGAGWVSYNTHCPTCEKQTLWRATEDGAWCNECCLFVEKTPSEDALVSIHAGDTIPTLFPTEIPTKCRDSEDHRETQTDKPYFVGGCDWGGSEDAPERIQATVIRYLIETADEALKEASRRILAAADIKQILQTSVSVRVHTEQELEALKDWIIETHLRSVTLSLVQKGKLAIVWCGNEPGFHHIIQTPQSAAEQTEQPNQKEETHE